MHSGTWHQQNVRRTIKHISLKILKQISLKTIFASNLTIDIKYLSKFAATKI